MITPSFAVGSTRSTRVTWGAVYAAARLLASVIPAAAAYSLLFRRDSLRREVNVFGVILGTGIGGGIVVEGRIWRGPNAIAGEWGHNPLPAAKDDERSGPDCYCGRSGCIETFLSGPGMARDHSTVTGRQLDPPAIVKAAEASDNEAEGTLKLYEDRLARGLASVINVLDPDVIVLGGGLSNIECFYEHVPALWGRNVFSDTVETRLVGAALGDSSGVHGAARL